MEGTKNKKVQVYEALKRRIIDVELQPGLPINEAVFAEDLGVSKTPIREALRQLERDGFVENVPGRGSTITYITSNEIQDVFQIREIIEVGVARKAAVRKGNTELEKIREDGLKILEAGELMEEKVLEWGKWENIHSAIIRSIENDSLEKIYSGLMDRMTRIKNHYGQRFTKRRFNDILTEHLALLDAIFSGDEEAAGRRMQEHLSNASSYVLGL